MTTKRLMGRDRRKFRIRKKLSGTPARPRLTVFRSAKHVYAQVVDDTKGETLVHYSTLHKGFGSSDEGTKTDAAKLVGQECAKLCIARGIDKVVFDRNGFIYHGRVKAIAEGAREGGLKF